MRAFSSDSLLNFCSSVDPARVVLQSRGILHVPQELQLSHGQQPAGVAGMSGHKDQVAIFHTVGDQFR